MKKEHSLVVESVLDLVFDAIEDGNGVEVSEFDNKKYFYFDYIDNIDNELHQKVKFTEEEFEEMYMFFIDLVQDNFGTQNVFYTDLKGKMTVIEYENGKTEIIDNQLAI